MIRSLPNGSRETASDVCAFAPCDPPRDGNRRVAAEAENVLRDQEGNVGLRATENMNRGSA